MIVTTCKKCFILTTAHVLKLPEDIMEQVTQIEVSTKPEKKIGNFYHKEWEAIESSGKSRLLEEQSGTSIKQKFQRSKIKFKNAGL